jgi:hypothetical protein
VTQLWHSEACRARTLASAGRTSESISVPHLSFASAPPLAMLSTRRIFWFLSLATTAGHLAFKLPVSACSSIPDMACRFLGNQAAEDMPRTPLLGHANGILPASTLARPISRWSLATVIVGGIPGVSSPSELSSHYLNFCSQPEPLLDLLPSVH